MNKFIFKLKYQITSFLYKYSWYYRYISDNRSDRIEFKNAYSSTPCKKTPGNDCIIMFSGKASLWKFDLHGGLADRLKGIVSVYKACLDTNRPFKILHTKPYKLDLFLIPNKYDWTITENSINYNINAVEPHYLRHAHEKDEERYLLWRLKKIFQTSQNNVLHIYSNAKMINDLEYKILFNQLFKPSPVIENEINNHLLKLKGNYISLSFRFCHLLGDPVDEYLPELKQEEKVKLLSKTLKCIEYFHQQYPSHNLLINSDSTRFINYIKTHNLDYTYIIPGNPIHIDQVKTFDYDTMNSYIKTFVDFFMISKAEKVFLIKDQNMRNSGFPKVASIIGGKPFEIYSI